MSVLKLTSVNERELSSIWSFVFASRPIHALRARILPSIAHQLSWLHFLLNSSMWSRHNLTVPNFAFIYTFKITFGRGHFWSNFLPTVLLNMKLLVTCSEWKIQERICNQLSNVAFLGWRWLKSWASFGSFLSQIVVVAIELIFELLMVIDLVGIFNKTAS